jgi:hypothetical protein
MMTERNNPAELQTSISSGQADQSSAVFASYGNHPSGRVYALFGQTESPAGFGVYGYSEKGGVGVEGRSDTNAGVVGVSGAAEVGHSLAATGVYGNGTSNGVRGQSATGVGVVGVVSPAQVIIPAIGVGVHGYGPAIGVQGVAPSSGDPGVGVVGSGRVGVRGRADAVDGFGVQAESANGVGLRAVSTGGTALRVEGKARLSRSGRASVPRNRAYVDVDLTALGGLDTKSLCFANLAYPRSGVYVRAVRPNYPAAGKMRIYLNKVASTSAATQLSWLVLEGA